MPIRDYSRARKLGTCAKLNNISKCFFVNVYLASMKNSVMMC